MTIELKLTDEQMEEMDKQIEEEGPVVPVGQEQPQPEVTPEMAPPEDNTFDEGSSESLTPELDAKVDKYSASLNNKK